MSYDSKKLACYGQPIAGVREWVYTDTGGETIATYESNGWFSDAKDYGVVAGDPLTLVNLGSNIVLRGRFTTVQDTGGSQGTATLDTGPDIPG